MSLLLVTALSVSAPLLPQCSWARPGANPFMGDVVAAVDRYQDIPAGVRAQLKKRIAARKYDEIATITRDSVIGAYRYDDLRDMHFGQGTICRTVTRDRWAPEAKERGLVYCEDGHCLIVPTVCRNLSRVTRVPAHAGGGEVGPPAPEPGGLQPAVAAAPDDLAFEPPGAGSGRSFAAAAGDSVLGPPEGSVAGLDGGSIGEDPSSRSGTGLDSGSGWGPGLGGPPLFSSTPPGHAAAPPFAAGAVPGGPSGLPGLAPVPGINGVTAVPEPSAYLLAATGAGLIAWLRRRKKRAAQRDR